MKSFAHHNARSLEEALDLWQHYQGEARFLAGGSDLLGVLKDGVLPKNPQAVINLKTIAGLDEVTLNPDGLRLGPLVRLSPLISLPSVAERFPLLMQAAQSVAFTQIRNVATVGGNLCQDTRCWYYRYPRQLGGPLACWRKGDGPCHAPTGDNRYHAVLGGQKCFAAFPSDMGAALAALDAVLELTGPQGRRSLPVAEFYTPAGNLLAPGELVTDIRVPAPPQGARQVFRKHTLRRPVDFALVSVAALFATDEGQYGRARLCLGGVAPIPWRAREAESLLEGRPLGLQSAAEAAEAALAQAKPLSGNAYKVDIAKTLVRRALTEA
jgi:xanthine dehydrogenase YagS FAD-binding subunit